MPPLPDRSMEGRPGVEPRIHGDGSDFTASDAELLRAVDDEGSLNRATEGLGRSFAHAQRRIDELEEAFGPLLERTRGGAGGGGSELTANANELLARFNRLRAEGTGLVEADRTVLPGRVRTRDGELGEVETPAGTVLALVPPGAESVEVSIRADAVTLHRPSDVPEPSDTSARNRFEGTVAAVERGERVAVIDIDIGADSPLKALVTTDSVERLALETGQPIVASFKATATRAVTAG